MSGLVPLLLALTLFPLASPFLSRELAEPRRVGSSYLILNAEHPLRLEERRALERIGCRILRELGDARYIVKADQSASDRVADEPFIDALQPIPQSWRVTPSAARELARFDAMAHLNVLFHDDVTLERARGIITSAGGWLAAPLLTDFQLPRRLEITIPERNVDALTASEEVLQLHGPMPHIKAMNASAAVTSAVTPLYAAPYELTGSGVVVSVWDYGNGPALADVAHLEFEGRVEKNGTSPVDTHPTHVTGTIAAKGTDSRAKGMAPAVRVQNFAVSPISVLEDKDANFTKLSIRADNNSWGFVQGWDFGGQGWAWYGGERSQTDAYFGGYSLETAAIDKLARDHQTLIVFSAGNDNDDSGPGAPPFEHVHATGTRRFCYSENGSGTDCPVQCQECETIRHKSDGPFQSLNAIASAKNTLAVGAILRAGTFGCFSAAPPICSFSSTGPTADGRVKPELVASGSNFSTFPNNQYGRATGTSMSAPVVTGIAALVVEQWRRTFAGADPAANALRVVLVHGAEDLGNPGPDYTYGFGLANAKNSVDTIIADGASGSRIKSGTITQGTTLEFGFSLPAGAGAKFTLGWPEPESVPFAAMTLINNLDLKVIAPNGDTIFPFVLNPGEPSANASRGVNQRDNLEQLVIENAAGGSYRLQVTGSSIPGALPQPFAVASTASLGPLVVACTDTYEPNDTGESAFGRLPSGTSLSGRFCASNDIDFFNFVVDRSGPVTVTVSATDTPLRVTLLANGATVQVMDVAAGASGTMQTNAGTGLDQPLPPITYLVKIEPAGPLGSTAAYTLSVSYRQVAPTRRRSARP
jgi:subtilisin family serine protease